MLSIQGLTKSYGTRAVLRNMSFDVPAGSSLGIIGPGGCGKSVLLKLIAGLEKPDRGAILLEGRDLVPFGEAALFDERMHMGMLFQNYALFDYMRVGENVSFPLVRGAPADSEVERRVAEVLEQVGLPNSQHLFPQELSGGMRKRVGIARALVARPSLLLLDEPSAGLDPISTTIVNDLIRSLQQEYGVTSVMTSFDFDVIESVVDHVALLYEGHVRFYGTPAEIRATADPFVRHLVEGTVYAPA